jgi:hypothetical protein
MGALVTIPTAGPDGRHLHAVPDQVININCALWTICGRDADDHVTIVEGHTEGGDLIEVELHFCDGHAAAFGVTEGGAA